MMKGETAMKKIASSLAIVSILCFGLTTDILSAAPPPLNTEVLQKINLPIPKNPEEKNYLGLSGDGTFKIPKIKSRVVIVEVFSMYCPYCQKDAPGINEMYGR
jgi:protein-disulfide isomerase